MLVRDRYYILPLILLVLTAFFLFNGIKTYQASGQIKPQNKQVYDNVAKLKKEIISLQRFESQPGVPLTESYQALKNTVSQYALLHGLDYTVRVFNQKDYSLATDYISKSHIPGINKLDVVIKLGAKENYWQLADLIWELFKIYPLEFNYRLSASADRQSGPWLISFSAEGLAKSEGVVTLYGI